MSGWIKLHRQITEHWIWQDPVKLKWWLTMLHEVNYKEGKMLLGGRLVNIKPGQSTLSVRSWADVLDCNRTSVERFFKLLESDGMIERKIIGKGRHSTTLINITNYVNYQGLDEPLDRPLSKPLSKPLGSHKVGHKVATIEESKESKEGKNIYIPEFQEFLNYAKENEPDVVENDLMLKYKSWKENKWRDGNNKKIVNWKSKLLNTLPYLKKEKSSEQKEKAPIVIGRQTEETVKANLNKFMNYGQ